MPLFLLETSEVNRLSEALDYLPINGYATSLDKGNYLSPRTDTGAGEQLDYWL